MSNALLTIIIVATILVFVFMPLGMFLYYNSYIGKHYVQPVVRRRRREPVNTEHWISDLRKYEKMSMFTYPSKED